MAESAWHIFVGIAENLQLLLCIVLADGKHVRWGQVEAWTEIFVMEVVLLLGTG